MIKSSVVRIAVPAVMAVLLLAGCSDQTPGEATGDPQATTTTEETSQAPTSKSGAPVDLKMCELLSSSGVEVTAVEEDGPEGCDAEYPGDVSVGIDLRDSGLKDYNLGPNSEASDTTIGGHKAKYVKKPTTAQSCAIALELTSSSRIDVFATSNDDMNKSCAAVEAVAKGIEPKLP